MPHAGSKAPHNGEDMLSHPLPRTAALLRRNRRAGTCLYTNFTVFKASE